MKYAEAIKAAKDGALVTDGDHVYKIIQRQTLGIPFDEIDVDPITVTNMWRVKK